MKESQYLGHHHQSEEFTLPFSPHPEERIDCGPVTSSSSSEDALSSISSGSGNGTGKGGFLARTSTNNRATKGCSICGQQKPISEFPMTLRRKKKYYECKFCIKLKNSGLEPGDLDCDGDTNLIIQVPATDKSSSTMMRASSFKNVAISGLRVVGGAKVAGGGEGKNKQSPQKQRFFTTDQDAQFV